MKKRLVTALLFTSFLAVSARAEVPAISDRAATDRGWQIISIPPKALESVRSLVMEAVPPERLPFWNDLFPVIESLLNQRHDEALSGFARLFAAYPRSAIGDLNHIFLLRLRGVTLGKAGRYSEAIQAYDDLLRQYGDDPNPGIRRQIVCAMNHRAVTLGDAGDFEAQIQAFDALLDAFKNTTDADVQNVVLASWFTKVIAYKDEGYPDESRRTFQEMERMFPDVIKNMGLARIAIIFSQVNENQTDKPLGMLPKGVMAQLRSQPTPSPALEEAEASSMLVKAMRLDVLQGGPREIALYDTIIARHRDSKNGKVQGYVAMAMSSKALLLERLGNIPATVEAYRDFESWAGTEKAPEAQNAIAMGMFSRSFFLGRSSDRREAIDEYDKLIGRFKEIDNDSVQTAVATALLMKAQMLDELGDSEAAYSVVTELIETYGGRPFYSAKNMAEQAESLREKLAGQLGKAH